MEIFVTSVFEKSVKRLAKRFRSMKDIYKQILLDLQENISIGEEIQGHQNFYKARYPNPEAGRGKSGGFRVIYFCNGEKKIIILVDIYSKTDQIDVNWDKVTRAMVEIEEKEKE
jgi:mRNA-degrading endonuclease RelE of RelBE toxin-antitoxin system